MRAIFAVSSSTATAGNSDSANKPSRSLTKRASASQLSSPKQAGIPGSVSPDSIPRRVKSKPSLRSLGSSPVNDNNSENGSGQTGFDSKTLVRPSILRRLSPGLAARVKLLDSSTKTPTLVKDQSAVGRIPHKHLKELDSLHQDLSIRVVKRGRAWSGLQIALDRGTPSSSGWVDVALEPLEVASLLKSDSPTMSLVSSTPGVAVSNSAPSEAQTDFEKYLDSSAQNAEEPPPPPPPKDSPSPPSGSSSNVQSYFNPMGLHRTESIYSFSRASFSNQLSQLTSITLPQPSSLKAGIAGIANAPAAVRALSGAAEQIQFWIKKAYDVLSGLDAEDDVEWAAAGGREGLEGVDKAITRFESLVNIYVKAIEEVQLRPDIGTVDSDSLRAIVFQMELILKNWAEIKTKLKGVKEQVELAMEWEELWTNVLGDVGQEMDSLSGLIFEMEEKRHQTMATESGMDGTSGLDINELETIVEESPSIETMASNKRFSIGPAFNSVYMSETTPSIQKSQDDSNYSRLMALFARMQPLRASLDFLPMRLSMFQSRADKIFPSACEELEDRRNELEQSYKALEADAEALRKELEEDRWILVFRNAGSQAQKMFDSVERSISKLQEAFEAAQPLNHSAALAKRIESYEAKKQHYVPAINRVVSIIQKGVKDRLTVNGEILTLLSDMQSRTNALKTSIKVIDSSLEEVNFSQSQQLRDSISSIISMESPVTASAVDTPGSSPASSVIINSAGALKGSSTPLGTSSRRGSSVGSSTARNTFSKSWRHSGIPQPLTGRRSSIPKTGLSTHPSPASVKTSSATAPSPSSRQSARPAPNPASNKPRWNLSTNTSDLDVGHNCKPVSPLSSSYRKAAALKTPSKLPTLSPLRRDQSTSPAPGTTRSTSRVSSRLGSRSPMPSASPTPSRSLLGPPAYSKLRSPSAPLAMSTVPRARQSFAGVPVSRPADANGTDSRLETPSKTSRPGTALGHSTDRRVSLLPLPKSKARDSSTSGHSKLDHRPPWRG